MGEWVEVSHKYWVYFDPLLFLECVKKYIKNGEVMNAIDIDVLLDSLEEYIKAVMSNANDPAVEAYVSMSKQKAVLKEQILSLLNIKEEVEEPKPVYDGVKCPECGGEMVSRKGKYGIFWGCKKYPKCNGTRDSEGKSREDRDREKREREAQVVEPIDERFRFRKG